MATRSGGVWAERGVYIDMDNGEMVRIQDEGGVLPGSVDKSYLKMPGWFGTTSLLVGSFVFRCMFPFVILGTVAFCLASAGWQGLASLWVSAGRLARVQPQPAASFLTSHKEPEAGKLGGGGFEGESGSGDPLAGLEEEIAARRRQELDD